VELLCLQDDVGSVFTSKEAKHDLHRPAVTIFFLSSWSYLFYLLTAGVDTVIVSPDHAQ
jgi:hypothetical protein